MKNYLLNYLKENSKILKILLICLTVGITCGIITYNCLASEIKNELILSIKSTLDLANSNEYEGINVLKNGIISNMFLVMIVYLFSITLIAPFCICGVNIIKGFSIGIYLSTLFSIFGFGKGLLSLFLIIILPNIIYLPAYMYMCCNSINLHYLILESNNKLSIFFKEAYKIIISLSLIILSIVIEQLSSFGVIGLYIM